MTPFLKTAALAAVFLLGGCAASTTSLSPQEQIFQEAQQSCTEQTNAIQLARQSAVVRLFRMVYGRQRLHQGPVEASLVLMPNGTDSLVWTARSSRRQCRITHLFSAKRLPMPPEQAGQAPVHPQKRPPHPAAQKGQTAVRKGQTARRTFPQKRRRPAASEKRRPPNAGAQTSRTGSAVNEKSGGA